MGKRTGSAEPIEFAESSYWGWEGPCFAQITSVKCKKSKTGKGMLEVTLACLDKRAEGKTLTKNFLTEGKLTKGRAKGTASLALTLTLFARGMSKTKDDIAKNYKLLDTKADEGDQKLAASLVGKKVAINTVTEACMKKDEDSGEMIPTGNFRTALSEYGSFVIWADLDPINFVKSKAKPTVEEENDGNEEPSSADEEVAKDSEDQSDLPHSEEEDEFAGEPEDDFDVAEEDDSVEEEEISFDAEPIEEPAPKKRGRPRKT